MSATSGIAKIGDYTTGEPVNKAVIDLLIDLIPDPDTAPAQGGKAGSGVTGGRGFLDQMSPACAAQLLVELAAVKAAIENV